MVAPSIWKHSAVNTSIADKIASSLKLHPVVARLLVNRGITSDSDAQLFLRPTLDQLHDPFMLTDLQIAVDRVLLAIKRHEKIAVHGDYDVDGVTATVIMYRILSLLGGNVIHYIPNRLSDGYGLSSEGIDRLKEAGTTLVVTVDCGIKSTVAAERARAVGVDLIITDHHQPGATLPQALAVINPRRQDCRYPDKNLAGVGVAFKLIQALCQRTDHTNWLSSVLKLVALGTIADVVPLQGENRVMARLGLNEFARNRNSQGLQALIDSCDLTTKRIRSQEIGFLLAPRINAAGRMASPDIAVRLLLTMGDTERDDAKTLAQTLARENSRRRREEGEVFEAAFRQIESNPEVRDSNILIVWGRDWHRGVIGIVASKLKERFNRPAIVLSVDGDLAHGSARSVPGFNLLNAMEECGRLFEQFGGHSQAAGMVVRTKNLDGLRTVLSNVVNRELDQEQLSRSFAIDATLRLSDITPGLMGDVERLEPFGRENAKPIFQVNPVEIVNGPHVIKDIHLRMTVNQDGHSFRAMAWRAAGRISEFHGRRSDLALLVSLSENSYRGETFIQLDIADIK